MAAVLDTHAAIWYVFTPSVLSQAAIQFVRQATADGKPLYISAISLVEIIYLAERKRIPLEALQRIESALRDNSSSLVVAPLDAAVAEAVPRIPTSHCLRYARSHHRSDGSAPRPAPRHSQRANPLCGDQDNLVMDLRRIIAIDERQIRAAARLRDFVCS
jgi:PIN domain nuclease of toxin-antitoxin system